MACLNQHPDLNVYPFEPLCNSYSALDLSLFDFKISECDILGPELHSKICQAKYLRSSLEKYDGVKLLNFHIKNDIPDILPHYKLIYLCRKDKLAQYVSLQIALKTRVWISDQECTEKITINLDDMIQRINHVKKQEQDIIDKYKPLVVYYEDPINSSCCSVFKYVNVDEYEVSDVGRKCIRKPLSEIVTNYHEVIDAAF